MVIIGSHIIFLNLHLASLPIHIYRHLGDCIPNLGIDKLSICRILILHEGIGKVIIARYRKGILYKCLAVLNLSLLVLSFLEIPVSFPHLLAVGLGIGTPESHSQQYQNHEHPLSYPFAAHKELQQQEE